MTTNKDIPIEVVGKDKEIETLQSKIRDLHQTVSPVPGQLFILPSRFYSCAKHLVVTAAFILVLSTSGVHGSEGTWSMDGLEAALTLVLSTSGVHGSVGTWPMHGLEAAFTLVLSTSGVHGSVGT